MASFAKIGTNNEVIEILRVNNDVILDANGVESEANGVDFLTKLTGWAIWKQTSYSGSIRKNYASVGCIYDKDRDAFILPKPFDSWTLNEETCQWEPPVPQPDNKRSSWNEETQQWDLNE